MPNFVARAVSFAMLAGVVSAQVYSPKVFLKGQPDPTDLRLFADGIVAQAHASTSRQKAAEVFYDGGYHYFDSDLMGYTTLGDGKMKTAPVASVQEIANDGKLLVGKLEGPKEAKFTVDDPWYPADVRAGSMPDIADIFTSTKNNWVFTFQRYAQGHSMDFTLRRGERLTRYFGPESNLFYVPFEFNTFGLVPFSAQFGQYQFDPDKGPASE